MPETDEIFHALANEAGLAAEHLAVGATALGRANYAERAFYAQAFFALSVGLERSCKLILVVDHALREGDFPSNEQVRRYRHDLSSLLEAVDKVAKGLSLDADRRLPQTEIHKGIIGTLSNFADNLTRYYNLDLVTRAAGVQEREDPIAEWVAQVTQPVLAKHYRERHQRHHLANAYAMEQAAGPHMMVRFFTEDGKLIDSPGAMVLRSLETEFARRWERMYVLQLARFVGKVLSELGFRGNGRGDIPYFSEFFALFGNSDAYLRGRKTWSIHRR
ncbi:MAG TPA: hypothetical protein VG448_03190 [Solirubrobacterales bacterium]|nr:hypothetical protein [Solirubrobacterales bacterium]